MNQNFIAFVCGVDKNGTQPPAGFPNRFAVLTWFEYEREMADPWLLFRSAIPRIAALVGAKKVMAEYWQQTMRLYVKKVFQIGCAFWTKNRWLSIQCRSLGGMVGGPRPYHDSLTISFFTATPLQEARHCIFVEEAGKLGVSMQETNGAEHQG